MGETLEVETPSARFTLDTDRCTGCGECMEACPTGALLVAEAYLEVDESRCRACGSCARACPTGALRMQPRA
ncbi:4Fe-4S binding protein [Methanopyrus sp.]